MEKIKYFIASHLSHDYKQSLFVRVNEVCYFKTVGNTLFIGLKNGVTLETKAYERSKGNYISIYKMMDVLPENFFRSAKDSIVNLDLIDDMKNYFSDSFIVYFGEREIVFSRRKSVEFREKYKLSNQLPLITIPD